mmetsp:Transcript_107329/g.280291  ORF Transcript_107329/g.280291 Transcript_107329/m.280291 type:complete len:125 (+) Transcript_107329:96-470(+)
MQLLGAGSLSKSKPLLVTAAAMLSFVVALTYITGVALAFEAPHAEANPSVPLQRLAASPGGATDDGASADVGQAAAEESSPASSAMYEVLRAGLLLVVLHPFEYQRAKRSFCECTQTLLLTLAM